MYTSFNARKYKRLREQLRSHIRAAYKMDFRNRTDISTSNYIAYAINNVVDEIRKIIVDPEQYSSQWIIQMHFDECSKYSLFA